MNPDNKQEEYVSLTYPDSSKVIGDLSEVSGWYDEYLEGVFRRREERTLDQIKEGAD